MGAVNWHQRGVDYPMTALNDNFTRRLSGAMAGLGLIPRDARLLVAVSGGADSVALLHGLHRLGCAVEAAHFDHQTRGGESARDAAFVRALCAGLGVPFHLGTAPVAATAAESGRSFEDEARRRRYAFFRDCAARAGLGCCATAHHMDDQAETVLMRILQGTGGRGLAGIPPRRMEGGLVILRPLLGFRREELRAWLSGQGLEWREDHTNAEPVTPRNRLRHGLLPLLAAEHNPQIVDALARLAEAQRLDNDLLDQLAGAAFDRVANPLPESARPMIHSLDPVAFAALAHALRRRVLLRLAGGCGVRPDHDLLLRMEALLLEGRAGARVPLDTAKSLYRGHDVVLLCDGDTVPDGSPETVPLPVPGEAAFLGHLITARRLDGAFPRDTAGLRACCHSGRQLLALRAVPGPLAVRAWRPGDRFTPLGMSNPVKLQDYFVNRHVPEPLRARVPLVVCGDDILWVAGHGPAAVAAVREDTAEVLEIEVRDAIEP